MQSNVGLIEGEEVPVTGRIQCGIDDRMFVSAKSADIKAAPVKISAQQIRTYSSTVHGKYWLHYGLYIVNREAATSGSPENS
jgi:hypothetical protein